MKNEREWVKRELGKRERADDDAHSVKNKSQSKLRSLALFDLDDTILAGDSDYLWGLYLIEQGKVSKKEYLAEHVRFKTAYENEQLDMAAYTKFSTRVLRIHDETELIALRNQFTEQVLLPLIRPKMVAIMKEHRTQGNTVIIITATNEFVVAELCNRLPADTYLATQLARDQNGIITGAIKGIPSFRSGKWERLKEWIARHPDHTLEGSTFYSDSANDLFLLERVTYPVVVNGDDKLVAKAKSAKWKLLSL
ncbi:hypothetical protein COTS27_01468 [Spirochaetota bacterium]|nr:hypothetical protein COTS27_01468 [Spirochaetota bacterium]